MNDIRIGAIERVNVRLRGTQFGFFVHLSGYGWGANHFTGGAADPNPPAGDDPDEHFDQRTEDFAVAMHRAARTCVDAGVKSVPELKGKPVAVTFNPDGTVLDWRILTEAIPKR